MKITVIFGTRPEAIKLAPVIMALKKNKHFKCRVIVTAQHRQMLDQVLQVFNIKPDIDLNLMEKNQTLAGFAAKALTALDKCFKKEKPDMVLVQGDTTTTWAASLAAFYNKIKIGHVEAGLRTNNRYSPFPEEINRILTTHIADMHFAPTYLARENLLKEGIPKSKIFITGNTAIDALHIALKKVRSRNYNPRFNVSTFVKVPTHNISPFVKGGKRGILINFPFILITGHRRENFRQGFRNICKAIKTLAHKFPDHFFIYPVHFNPNVRKYVMKTLSKEKNIILTDPVDYLSFIWLMDNCQLILTDSGGVLEEAPSIGKPILIMRDTTERLEALKIGAALLTGVDPVRIQREASKILYMKLPLSYRTSRFFKKTKHDIFQSEKLYNPYGNGNAAQEIIKIIEDNS